MRVVPGPASPELGEKVAKALGVDLVRLESKVFPDGDSYLRVRDDVRGEDLAIIQSTYPPQDRNLLQLFLLVDGLKDLGAGRLYAVVPYMAYMRQDKRFLDGEIISARSILRLMSQLEIERLLTIDAFNREILSYVRAPAEDLTAVPLLANWIRSQGWQSPFIVAPDKGAAERAKMVSEALGTDYTVGRKSRDRTTGSVALELDKDLSVKGRVAVIVDDTIAKGDTVVKSAELLLKAGANKVSALCTHGLFLPDALARMRQAGVQDVVSTDTVPTPNSKITVAPIVADALRRFAS